MGVTRKTDIPAPGPRPPLTGTQLARRRAADARRARIKASGRRVDLMLPQSAALALEALTIAGETATATIIRVLLDAEARQSWRGGWVEQTFQALEGERIARRDTAAQALSEFDRLVFDEAVEACRRREAMTGYRWEIDHMIPLARGGAHAWHNLQVIPYSLNSWKRDSMVLTEPGQWVGMLPGADSGA